MHRTLCPHRKTCQMTIAGCAADEAEMRKQQYMTNLGGHWDTAEDPTK